MQRFRNRIFFYGIGFSIGVILMFFMFGTRGCSWMPENQVKNSIGEKEIIVGDSLKEIMACANVTNDDVYLLLKEDGDVDFSLSKPQEKPKKYWIGGLKNGQDINVTYAILNDSTAEVIDFNYSTKGNCASTLSNVYKSTIPLPDVDVRAIIESQQMRIMTKAECQMKCFGFKEEEVLSFHKTASIEIELSKPRQYPNPVYVLKGKIRNSEVLLTYTIGDNRTRIADISPDTCSCKD